MIHNVFFLIIFNFATFCNAQVTGKNQFDFWIGDWDVSWEETDGKLGKGTNHIEKILDGKAIQENFIIIQGEGKGFKGTSISTYNEKEKKWKQVWIDNQGGHYDFHGVANNDNHVFITDAIEIDGKRIIYRMVFKDIKKDSFIWDWESSSDNAKTWNLKWRIFYQRKSSNKTLADEYYGKLNPEAPKETIQFGRLVGMWQCTSMDIMPDSTWYKSKANWIFKYDLDGFAIEDIWIERKEDKTNNTLLLGRNFYGKNLRIFNPKLDKWQCVWINNKLNSIFPIWEAAQNKKGDIIMKDDSNKWRIVFYDIMDNSFEWKYEILENNIWVAKSKISATKIQ